MRYLVILLPVLLGACSGNDPAENSSKPAVAEKPQPVTVEEASYGLSCKDFPVAAPAINTVSVGNATSAVAGACAKAGPDASSCTYTVDVGDLGDPATTCAKDFSVKWRCGSQEHVGHLDGESNGKSVTMSCT